MYPSKSTSNAVNSFDGLGVTLTIVGLPFGAAWPAGDACFSTGFAAAAGCDESFPSC